jgi:hypothetical protein
MATCDCKSCGMSVNASCGKRNAPLANATLSLDDGREAQISECPNSCG